ncbi:MarR family winged helix-turn-helix transcriptional regulator [Streptomyces sp. VRA16 Mangrove soil]|uniref:MarR family winged helix-turn-helix transcriptional regulator n=1 Tax=Streptomyces sp. VRA16 Mangrove soil TaxID=2817434 RepID=UPI001A9F62B0|nr:MarR family transcriptional regulator [Streptomyces sp. VRA16 Mangrove soil]MBO1332952.1 MarR family transcriptional regulator [Streptomyces sp. VRA16 Mangrove soil]
MAGQQRQGPDVLTARLGYLLKHAQARLTREVAEALRPFGIDGHTLAVLVVIAAEDSLSQAELAGLIGVDRTTMVALVDRLEEAGLVERRRSAQDRRKNVVALTASGRDRLRRAERARARAERAFLAPLGEGEAQALTAALRRLVSDEP